MNISIIFRTMTLAVLFLAFAASGIAQNTLVDPNQLVVTGETEHESPKFEIFWNHGGQWKSGGGWGAITIRDNLMTHIGNLDNPIYNGPAEAVNPCFMVENNKGVPLEVCITMSGCPFFVVSGTDASRQVYVPTSCMSAPEDLTD